MDQFVNHANGDGFNVRIETITPDIAAKMLEMGEAMDNRRLRDHKVKEYAQDMADGKWLLTGEAIKFDPSGVLIDGQHRLWAVIQSGATIQSLVVYGVAREAFVSLDTGIARTLGDFLHIHGYANENNLAAAIRAIFRYKRMRQFRPGGKRRVVDNYEALSFLTEHPEIEEMVRVARQTDYRPLAITASILSATYFLFSELDEEDADAFIERLGVGIAEREDDPIFMLRNTLIREKDSARYRRTVSEDLCGALTIKAWNAWRDGQPVKLLRWSPGGAKPEPMPEPR